MFFPAGPHFAIDIDGGLNERGGPCEWVPSLAPFNESTYMERSASGEGLHIIIEGEPPEWWTDSHFSAQKHQGVDVLENKFCAFTGDKIETSADDVGAVNAAAWLAEVYETINGGPPRSADEGEVGDGRDYENEVGVYDVISRTQYPAGENTAHPFHPSGTGHNFRVDEGGETFRCWRHGVTGNGGHLLGMKHGVIECGEWSPGGLDGVTWREIFDAARATDEDISEPQPAADGGAVAAETPDTMNHPTGAGRALTPALVAAEAEVESAADIESDSKKAFYSYRAIRGIGRDHFVATSDGELFSYDGGIWRGQPDGTQQLRELAMAALQDEYAKNVLSELIEQVRALDWVSRDQLGAPKGTIAVENGLLDLAATKNDPENALRDLRPADYVLNRLGTRYDPDADCELWKDSLRKVARDEDLPKLQEYAGYTLLHWAQPFKKALMLVGPRDSGKSTFTQTIRKLLGGQESVASETLFDLSSTRWGPAELFGHVANIRNEITPQELKYPQRFKELTGGEELISAEFKRQNKFKFVVTQKFIFSTNQVPDVADADDAFYNRWLIATFPTVIPESDQDEELGAKLEAELPGILNWAIEGYHRLIEQGHFTGERGVDDKKEMWAEHGDTIDRFKSEILELTGEAGDAHPKADVYALYTAFCDYLGQEAGTQHKLTRELKKDQMIDDKEQDGTRYYTGVKLAKINIGGRKPLANKASIGDSRQERFG